MKELSRRHFMSTALGAGALTLTPLARAADSQSPAKRRTENFDVVVVGAGFAGMCAALEAREKGANVVLLEKMSSPATRSTQADGSAPSGAASRKIIRKTRRRPSLPT